jgi:subtilisin family serine protease
MSRNVEDLLREGIDRLAADADADAVGPATLLHRARQHNRRRRQAIAGAIAAGTAAVTAAAVIIATAGTAGSNPSALHGQTITYVATRAEQALAHLNQEQAIEYSSETVRGSDFSFTVLNLANNPQSGSGSPTEPGVLANVHAVRQAAWTYRGLRLWQGYSTTGTLVYSYAVTPTEAYGAAYTDRTQWHTPISTTTPADVPATCQNAGFGYPTWANSIAKALSCHVFKLGGNQQVNGIEAVKLIRKFAGGYTMTLWVDPASYLPVRIAYGYPGSHGATITETVELHWLAPAQDNLARLHTAEQRGAIPPGFHELPSSYYPESVVNVPGPSH